MGAGQVLYLGDVCFIAHPRISHKGTPLPTKFPPKRQTTLATTAVREDCAPSFFCARLGCGGSMPPQASMSKSLRGARFLWGSRLRIPCNRVRGTLWNRARRGAKAPPAAAPPRQRKRGRAPAAGRRPPATRGDGGTDGRSAAATRRRAPATARRGTAAPAGGRTPKGGARHRGAERRRAPRKRGKAKARRTGSPKGGEAGGAGRAPAAAARPPRSGGRAERGGAAAAEGGRNAANGARHRSRPTQPGAEARGRRPPAAGRRPPNERTASGGRRHRRGDAAEGEPKGAGAQRHGKHGAHGKERRARRRERPQQRVNVWNRGTTSNFLPNLLRYGMGDRVMFSAGCRKNSRNTLRE